MGQRSQGQTVCAILMAFHKRRRWAQAELARHVGVGAPALRRRLEELVEAGLQLTSKREHPDVVWTAPPDWFPGAVVFEHDDVPQLLRQLARLPRSKGRERLMQIVVAQLPLKSQPLASTAVIARAMSEEEEQYVSTVEDAAQRKAPLLMSYLTAERGTIAKRHVSVHVVELGPPTRFVAMCHGANTLKRFRVDGIVHARVDGGEPFREQEPELVAKFCRESVDGYHGVGPAVEHSFFVREPECRWVVKSLLDGMAVTPLPGGVRVAITTPGLLRVARYVAGLGAAANAENVELLGVVEEMARGTLERSAERRREIAEVSGG